MRAHLILILFFTGTVLARSARNERSTNLTTIPPTFTSTIGDYDETSTDVQPATNCQGIKCLNPIARISNLFKSVIQFFINILKKLFSGGIFTTEMPLEFITNLLNSLSKITF